MNCLLSTLYAFWKTNSTDQGDYCYLLVYCSGFWTLQLRSGHHCVRHSAAPEQELRLAWKHFGAAKADTQRVGRGKWSLGQGCGSCQGVCTPAPATSPALSPVCNSPLLQ